MQVVQRNDSSGGSEISQREVYQPQRQCAHLWFGKFLPKTAWKLRNWTGGKSLAPPLDPPMVSHVSFQWFRNATFRRPYNFKKRRVLKTLAVLFVPCVGNSPLWTLCLYISSPMSNAAQNEISSIVLLAFITVVVNVISLERVTAGVSETFQEVSRCRTRTQLHAGQILNPRADVTKRPKQVYQCSHKKESCPPKLIFEKKPTEVFILFLFTRSIQRLHSPTRHVH